MSRGGIPEKKGDFGAAAGLGNTSISAGESSPSLRRGTRHNGHAVREMRSARIGSKCDIGEGRVRFEMIFELTNRNAQCGGCFRRDRQQMLRTVRMRLARSSPRCLFQNCMSIGPAHAKTADACEPRP